MLSKLYKPPPSAAWQSPAVPNFILEQSLTRSSFTLPIFTILSISDRVSSPCKAVQKDERYKQTNKHYNCTAVQRTYLLGYMSMSEGGTIDSLRRQTRVRDKPCPVASILQSSSLVQRPSPHRGWPSQNAPLQSSDGDLTSLLFIYRPLYIRTHDTITHTHGTRVFLHTNTRCYCPRSISP